MTERTDRKRRGSDETLQRPPARRASGLGMRRNRAGPGRRAGRPAGRRAGDGRAPRRRRRRRRRRCARPCGRSRRGHCVVRVPACQAPSSVSAPARSACVLMRPKHRIRRPGIRLTRCAGYGPPYPSPPSGAFTATNTPPPAGPAVATDTRTRPRPPERPLRGLRRRRRRDRPPSRRIGAGSRRSPLPRSGLPALSSGSARQVWTKTPTPTARRLRGLPLSHEAVA